MKQKAEAVFGWLDRHALILGVLLGALLSAALAVYNVSGGPLSNLNDIGGWHNRVIFIAMTAAVQMLLLTATAWMSPRRFGRMAIRQLLVTAGLLILLLAINHKSYLFVNQLLPFIRQMDESGLSAMRDMQLNLSAPAVTVLYLVTRGPIYDMYTVKLACAACFLLLALLAARAADRRGWGLRSEALLLLCLILPQGFLMAGSAPQIDVFSALLLAVSLTLLDERHPLAGMLLYGAAAACSGAALYALPLIALIFKKSGAKPLHAALAVALPLAACLPAMVSGVPALKALGSLFAANFAVPEYAAGVPNLMSAFPRAALEEMPEYALIQAFPEIDAVTNAPIVYTQAHFELLMRGLAIAALAMFIGLCAWLKQDQTSSALRKTLTLALGAMLLCPGAGVGAWMPLCMLCLAAILKAPETRLPACMVLFATAGGCCYPATGETLLRPAYAFAICAAALFMLLGVVPGAANQEVTNHAE